MTPSPYSWHVPLRDLFKHAVKRYRAGKREAAKFFNTEQLAALAAIGQTAQELFDFAEDHVKNDGDPDWETVLLISAVRRDYFLTVQRGVLSERAIVTADLPPKDDTTLGGIPWLKRQIAKAEAKLRGELPPDLMYDCGGDRRFFREHRIHPADFLREVWATNGDETRLLAYVQGQGRVGV
jgi:hypothetical protein